MTRTEHAASLTQPSDAQPHPPFAILRRRQVQAESGYSRSTIYLRMSQGLWPKPVSLGPRAVGWPAREVAAINAARIAGKSEDDIRVLVASLERDRRAPTRADR
jgi:prophage regulatory protein